MSKTGVEENVSPVIVLFAISAKKGDAVWGTDQNHAGQRARIFNDVLKEESKKIKADDAFVNRFKDLITSFSPPPLTQELVTKIENEFDRLKKVLVEDPQWEIFWDTIRDRKQGITNEPEFTEEDIDKFKVDVINGYRMKIFSLAQYVYEEDLKNQPPSEQVEKAKGKSQIFKDLILKINIATREKSQNETVVDYVNKYYKKHVGSFLMAKYSPNEFVQNVGKEARDGNLNEEQLRKLVHEKREALFQKMISVSDGDSNRVPYFKLNGDVEARKLFDQLMPEETLFNKLKNVSAINKLFDTDYLAVADIVKLDASTAMVKSAFYQITAATNDTMIDAQRDHFATLLRESKDQVVGKLKTMTFAELDLSFAQAKAFAGELGLAQDKNGKTMLESARESGKFTDEQYAELVKHANENNSIKLTLDDPEHYQLIRDHSVAFHYEENFVFPEGVSKIEKLAGNLEQNKDEIIKQANALHKDFIASMSEFVSPFASDKGIAALNLNDDQLEKAKKVFPLKENASKEEIQAALGVLKEIKDFCGDYVINQGLPAAAKALLQSKSPIHAAVKSTVDQKLRDFVIEQHKDKINDKNPEGQTPLQVAQKLGKNDLIPELIKAGANPDLKTTDYKRDNLTRFTDTVKGFFKGKGLSQWKTPPERSVTEIAEISGRKDIVESIQLAVIERKETVSKEQSKQGKILLNELDSTMRVQPQSTPKSTVQPNVPMVDVSSNPLRIESPRTITPLLTEQMKKPPSDPGVIKYLEDINSLLKEVEKAASEVDKSQSQEIKLIQVEKAALLQAKSAIEKSDISSPEGKADLSKKLHTVIGIANGRMKEINHGMVINSDLSNKREELLRDIRHEIRPEVSQPQKRGPTSNQRG